MALSNKKLMIIGGSLMAVLIVVIGILLFTMNKTRGELEKVEAEKEISVKSVIRAAYDAMVEKGYNPVNQIVGYIMSGDPTYITSHKGARSLIMKVERDEIVEELFKDYIVNNDWENQASV